MACGGALDLSKTAARRRARRRYERTLATTRDMLCAGAYTVNQSRQAMNDATDEYQRTLAELEAR
jgi:hypothetical protein